MTKNHSIYYDAKSFGFGAGMSVSGKTLGQQAPTPNSKLQTVAVATAPSYQGMGYGKDGDSNHSQTISGIGTQNITITNQNSQHSQHSHTDPQRLYTNITTDDIAHNTHINGIIDNSFDKNKVQQEIDFQQQTTLAFGQNAPQMVVDLSKNRMKQIANHPTLTQEQKEAEIAKWKEGGVYRVALHTLVGALGTGTVEGALTTGGVAASAPQINKLEEKLIDKLIAQGMDEDSAKATAGSLSTALLTTAGNLAGLDTASTATAVNVDAFNRQLHPPEKALARTLFEKAKKEGLKTADGKEYTLEQFEDALRLANHSGYNESYNDNILVNVQETSSKSKGRISKVIMGSASDDFDDADRRVWLSVKEDGLWTSYIQNLGNLNRPDENLVRFIQVNDTEGNYSWTDGWVQPYKMPTMQPLPVPRVAGIQAPTYPQSVLEMHNNTTKASNVNISGARTTNSYIADSLGKYGDSVVNTALSGFNAEAEAGGTAIVGLGVRQTTGKAFDTDRKICTTYTTCGLVGPMVGGYTHAGLSVSTGTATPGSRTWQLTGTGAVALGGGYGFGGSINSDGSITGGIEGTMGGALGGAIMICSKKVGETCVNQ